MKRPLVALTALVAFSMPLVSSLQAHPPDEPVPEEIQKILEKINSGQPPTADESQKLHDYALREPNKAGWKEVQEIMAKIKKEGRKPTAAELDLIKKFGAEMKGKEGKAKKDVEDLKKGLGAGGKGSGKKHKMDEGTASFTINVHATENRNVPFLEGNVHTRFQGSYPVSWSVTDESGELRIQLMPSDEGVASGQFNMNGSTVTEDQSKTSHASFGFTTKFSEGGLAMLELVSKKGLSRPFLYALAMAGLNAKGTVDTHIVDKDGERDEHGETGAAIGATPTIDGLHEESPLRNGAVPPQHRKLALANVPKEMLDAIRGARCTFDAGAFRKSWAAGQPFKTKVLYSYRLSKTDAQEEVVHHADLDVDMIVELEFGSREADLEIGPASTDAYRKWIPRPYGFDAPDADYKAEALDPFGIKPGEDTSVSFIVGFKPKAGATAPTGILEIELQDLSENKGICINYPRDGAQTKKGLFFVPDQEGLEITNKGLLAKTKAEVSSIKIKVAAREAGAYGSLVARCPARSEVATSKLTGKDLVRIPDDDDENNIADQWQLDMKIMGKNRPGTWDLETEPAGAGLGDGVTLFDEYRGVMIENAQTHKLEHVRLDPKKKKLFVWSDKRNPTGWEPKTPLDWHAIVHRGAAIYAAASGVTVHVFEDPDRVKDQGRKPPIVNFNSSAEPAHAVRVARNVSELPESTKARTLPVGGVGDHVSTDPSDCEAVYVAAQNIDKGFDFLASWWKMEHLTTAKNDKGEPAFPNTLAAIAKAGYDPDKIVAKIPENRGRMLVEYCVFTLAHELGHATGVKHHEPDWYEGDHACPMRYWDHTNFWVDFAFIEGRWHPDQSGIQEPKDDAEASFPAWRFCEVNRGEIRLKPKK